MWKYIFVFICFSACAFVSNGQTGTDPTIDPTEASTLLSTADDGTTLPGSTQFTGTDFTATDSTATDSTATDSTATDSTATDSTATDSTATDSTATDYTGSEATVTDSSESTATDDDVTNTMRTTTDDDSSEEDKDSEEQEDDDDDDDDEGDNWTALGICLALLFAAAAGITLYYCFVYKPRHGDPKPGLAQKATPAVHYNTYDNNPLAQPPPYTPSQGGYDQGAYAMGAYGGQPEYDNDEGRVHFDKIDESRLKIENVP